MPRLTGVIRVKLVIVQNQPGQVGGDETGPQPMYCGINIEDTCVYTRSDLEKIQQIFLFYALGMRTKIRLMTPMTVSGGTQRHQELEKRPTLKNEATF